VKRRLPSVVIVLASLIGLARAETVFGPETFKPKRGSRLQVFTRTFSVANPNLEYTLRLYNGGIQGELRRVSAAGVVVNDTLVVQPSEVSQAVAFLERRVTLAASNLLVLQVAGPSGSGITVRIDSAQTEPPTIAAAISPPPNLNGWNNTDVTVSFTCGPTPDVTCPPPVVLTQEGANQQVTGTATGTDGRTATVTVLVNIDKTPPVVTGTLNPSPNLSGWNSTDVTVIFAATDGLSGVDPATVTPAATISLEVASEEVQGFAVDLAGNTGQGSVIVNLDRTPPSIVAAAAPPPNANGWNNTDVTVTFMVHDVLSGVESAPDPVVLGSDGAAHVASATVTDQAGNSAAASQVVNIDKSAPTLTIVSPSGGSVIGDDRPEIIVDFSDATSGVDVSSLRITIDGVRLLECQTLAGRATCEPPPLEPGVRSVGAIVKDLAGNTGTAGASFDLVLVVPMEVAITAPAAGLLTRSDHVEVVGSVTPAASQVTVNGVGAVVEGATFRVEQLPIREGVNTITAIARGQNSGLGSASVSITRDTTAPRVAVESPTQGEVVNSSSATVVGIVNDVVVGTVNEENCTVTVSARSGSFQAEVKNRSFVARDVALVPGPNRLVVTATDTAGNVSAPFEVVLERKDAVGQRIRVYSGDGQSGPIRSSLPAPLVVALSDSSGAPLPGRQVSFRVSRGDGTLIAPTAEGRVFTATTDGQGRAEVSFRLGSRAGSGSHRVAAAAAGFAGEVVFSASAVADQPVGVKALSGEMQRGVPGQALPRPFVVFVHDAGGNPVEGATVRFEVIQGDASISGLSSLAAVTNGDGLAEASVTLGQEVGINSTAVRAALEGQPDRAALLTATSLLPGLPENTRVSGIVLDNLDVPIQGATVHIAGTTPLDVTDAQGQFQLAAAPLGTIHLVVDGSTSNRPGTWPKLEFELTTVSGQDNDVGMPIYLLPIDTGSAKTVGGPSDVTLTMANVPGFAVSVAAGSAHCPGGSSQCQASITQVHSDKVPMPPPRGVAPRLVLTVQPPGILFDPPARVTYPNVEGLPPGHVSDFFSFDHDLGQFVSVGTATVSEDGAVVTTDAGVGIVKAGWHFPQPDPPDDSCPTFCDDKNSCTIDTAVDCGCFYEALPDGSGCRDDGNPCTKDVCVAAFCTHPKGEIESVSISLERSEVEPHRFTQVTATVSPVCPATIDFEARPVEGSGGHVQAHHVTPRPTGGFSMPSCGTENGSCAVVYGASPMGGTETLVAKVREKPELSATKELMVLIKDLEQLTASDEWTRIGNTLAHPDAWWGTHGTIVSLMDIARAFLSVTGRLLEINDISLERGGLLDVNGNPKNWSPPHNTHRNGKYADIGILSTKDANGNQLVRMRSEDKPEFRDIFEARCGPLAFIREESAGNGSKHFHIRCESL